MLDFSDMQKHVWQNTINSYHRWNFSYGATRSGKTYLDYYKIPVRIRNTQGRGLILLLGNTKGTLERNILEPLRNIWGSDLVGHISSNNKVQLFGKIVHALGADKINQVSKLQGAGLEYCYGDEVQTWHEDVFAMLKSRLDKEGACFDGTANPDNPNHWLKKFLDSSADIFAQKFTIDDNPFNSNDFVINLKRELMGTVYYDRFILGNWVAAEGCIYNKFAANPQNYVLHKVPSNIIFATVGIDFGGNGSANTFQLTGFTQGLKQVITLDEYYSKDELDATQLANEFCKFVKKNQLQYKILEAYADSAEQTIIRSFKNELIKQGIALVVKNARKGEITERIRFYNMMFGCDAYKIMSHCKKTIEAFQNAVWQQGTVKDIRLDDGKMNIDTLDAQEYSTESLMQQITQAIQVRS